MNPQNGSGPGAASTQATGRSTPVEGTASDGHPKPAGPRQMPGLHREDRLAGTPDRGDGEVLRRPAGLPAVSGAAGSGTLAPGSLMTSHPGRTPARRRTPTAAGRGAPTDLHRDWVTAPRDEDLTRFRAWYEAQFPPPPGIRQEATA